MQTTLSQTFLNTPEGAEADRILRSCVHCGFCTATCPTYQLQGDELDGPRGRIYLIKQLLEGEKAGLLTQRHLDRCLLCRACETTCPSGVDYHRLLDIGRRHLEQRRIRPLRQRVMHLALRQVLPYRKRFGALLRLGQQLRPLLPRRVQEKLPSRQAPSPFVAGAHPRRVILLQGCVQDAAAPNTDRAARRVLDRLGITLVSAESQGCCGAMSQHLGAGKEALTFIRRNIDAWWPLLEEGAEAILVTASGCGSTVKEYGWLLRDDPEYAAKAERVAALTRDLSELLDAEPLDRLDLRVEPQTVSYHSPCSLQHGQQLPGLVEGILERFGFQLTRVNDSHLCCGSAGTYSLLQPDLSARLLANKLAALQAGRPVVIATANIGCQLHLASATELPVKHWIELVDEALKD
ncbi:MAG: glycolate oxidase subunit GlcF [Gammaproteobacteria bacterium]|nr:glycolate oxidase subunit GlcF [Gammaproteobacteria bacterium]